MLCVSTPVSCSAHPPARPAGAFLFFLNKEIQNINEEDKRHFSCPPNRKNKDRFMTYSLL